MITINCEQRSEAWHQNRLGRFTASIFSDVMAANNTSTYENVLAKIAGEIITGEEEESFSSPAMERGVELEDEAAEYYESIYGIKTEKIGLVIPDESDELHEWVGISPDRVVNNGLLEIKCPLVKTHLKYIRSGKLPNEYKWQVQGQLMVTMAEWCDFMSYYPNMKPFIIRVYPDKVMINDLRDRLIESVKRVNAILSDYKAYDYER